jgi:hypothetical protein
MSQGHDDYAVEPVWGLPEALPEGERILWQGQPRWQALAVRVFHARKVAIYFGLLAVWSIASGVADGLDPGVVARGVAMELGLGAAAAGLLVYLARLCARTTVYTITNRRVVMRIGMALPTSINLPFAAIETAALRRCRDGTGDLPLVLGGSRGVGYMLLWPHARPWQIGRPEPMLRALTDAEAVAELLGRALLAAAGPGGGVAPPLPMPGHASPDQPAAPATI